MKEPIKPEKKIEVSRSKEYNFGHGDRIVPLTTFLAWMQATVPKNVTDLCISLVDEDSSDYYAGPTNLHLSWKEIIDNPSYEKELKKYEKKLLRWQKENENA